MARTGATSAKPSAKIPALSQDSFGAELKAIRAEVASMARTMGTLSKEKLHGLADTVEAATDDTFAAAREMASHLEQEAEQAQAAVNQRVKAHPLQSILLAFGLGLIVSKLFRR